MKNILKALLLLSIFTCINNSFCCSKFFTPKKIALFGLLTGLSTHPFAIKYQKKKAEDFIDLYDKEEFNLEHKNTPLTNKIKEMQLSEKNNYLEYLLKRKYFLRESLEQHTNARYQGLSENKDTKNNLNFLQKKNNFNETMKLL